MHVSAKCWPFLGGVICKQPLMHVLLIQIASGRGGFVRASNGRTFGWQWGNSRSGETGDRRGGGRRQRADQVRPGSSCGWENTQCVWNKKGLLAIYFLRWDIQRGARQRFAKLRKQRRSEKRRGKPGLPGWMFNKQTIIDQQSTTRTMLTMRSRRFLPRVRQRMGWASPGMEVDRPGIEETETKMSFWFENSPFQSKEP